MTSVAPAKLVPPSLVEPNEDTGFGTRYQDQSTGASMFGLRAL